MRACGKYGSLKEDTTTPPFVREVIRFDVTWPDRPEHTVILFYHWGKRQCAVVCYVKSEPPDCIKVLFRYPISKYDMADIILLLVENNNNSNIQTIRCVASYH
jgi:hypothetical protein